MELQVNQNPNKGVVVILIGVIVALIILGSGGANTLFKSYKNDIKKHQNKVKELEKIIEKNERVLIEERKVREDIRTLDSLTIINLNSMRKKDSVKIKSLKILFQEQQKLTDDELDKEVKKIYEELNIH